MSIDPLDKQFPEVDAYLRKLREQKGEDMHNAVALMLRFKLIITTSHPLWVFMPDSRRMSDLTVDAICTYAVVKGVNQQEMIHEVDTIHAMWLKYEKEKGHA